MHVQVLFVSSISAVHLYSWMQQIFNAPYLENVPITFLNRARQFRGAVLHDVCPMFPDTSMIPPLAGSQVTTELEHERCTGCALFQSSRPLNRNTKCTANGVFGLGTALCCVLCLSAAAEGHCACLTGSFPSPPP